MIVRCCALVSLQHLALSSCMMSIDCHLSLLQPFEPLFCSRVFLLTLTLDYRRNHGDAPHPGTPSRGLVVVRSDDDEDDHEDEPVQHHSEFLWLPAAVARWNTAKKKQQQREHKEGYLGKRPLRLLVIGDSLAAGVGTSQSSTPILPESIAQALSKALGGRAVFWVCVGVPGQTSSEIVRDIHQLDDLVVPSPAIFHRLAEWQAEQRQRAQDRLETAKRRTQAWLEHRKEERQIDKDRPTETRRLVRWWKSIMQQVRRDIDGLRTVIVDDESFDGPESEVSLSRRLSNAQRNSIDPEVVGTYDVAIVLTGLNDLKEFFLPFMMSAQRAKALQEARKGNDDNGLKGELVQILHALEGKMQRILPIKRRQNTADEDLHQDANDDSIVVTKRSCHEKGPLIVFPALPYEPTSIRQHLPLALFIIPLLKMVDRNKQILSELYPGLVLYVASPDSTVWSDAEAKRGPQWEDFRVLLKLNDIAHDAKDRLEQLMKRHYENWVRDGDETEYSDLYDLDEFGVSVTQPVQLHPGFKLVAADGIHPSDIGYDMWGRHIASAIVKEWGKQSV